MALYFVVAAPTQGVATAVVVVLTIMTFAPVHVVHPFRARDYGAVPSIMAIAWAATTVPLLLPDLDVLLKTFLLLMSLGTAGAIIAMGLLRTFRGPRATQ